MHSPASFGQPIPSGQYEVREDSELEGLLQGTTADDSLPNLLAEVEHFIDDMKRSPVIDMDLESPNLLEGEEDDLEDIETGEEGGRKEEGEDVNNNGIPAVITKKEDGKPTLSYIALISLAIQSTCSKRMVLGDIYSWVANNYPYYRQHDRSWRNSIRHNLSLNECFVKSGRSENGKGNYWAIHPANVDDFSRGDFRRRRARRQVRKCNERLESLQGYLNEARPSCRFESSADRGRQRSSPAGYRGYVPMTPFTAPDHVIASMFGPEVLSASRRISPAKSSVTAPSPSPSPGQPQTPPTVSGTYQSVQRSNVGLPLMCQGVVPGQSDIVPCSSSYSTQTTYRTTWESQYASYEY